MNALLALVARYGAELRVESTEEIHPVRDCDLCPEHPAKPGTVGIYWAGGQSEVCPDHTEAGIQQAIQECDDAGDKTPRILVEVAALPVITVVAA